MAEEHGCQSPEGHRLCKNNCGFFGSTTTQNLCSKCYRDLSFKKAEDAFLKISPSKSNAAPAPEVDIHSPGTAAVVVVAQPSRCTVCKKKLGLTGFKCRCGTTFCGTHRYPEQHSCNFDFKTMGREAIAKANPLIKADKLDKI